MNDYFRKFWNVTRRRVRKPYLPLAVLVCFLVPFFLGRHFLSAYSSAQILGVLLPALFFLTLIAVLFVDFYKDIAKQRQKLRQHLHRPPAFGHVPEMIAQMNELQFQEVHTLLERAAAIAAERLRVPVSDVEAALLYRDYLQNLTSHPQMIFRRDEGRPFALRELQRIGADRAFQTGSLYMAQAEEDEAENEPHRWALSLPLKTRSGHTFLVLNLHGHGQKVDPLLLRTAALSVLKYAYMLYNVFVELATIQGEPYEQHPVSDR